MWCIGSWWRRCRVGGESEKGSDDLFMVWVTDDKHNHACLEHPSRPTPKPS